MKNSLLLTILGLMFMALSHRAAAQCNPDAQPPNAVCKDLLVVDNVNGSTGNSSFSAFDFNDGSFDNCTATAQLSFFAELAPASSTLPSSNSLSLPEGQYDVVMWVVDEVGNASHCTTQLTINQCPGSNTLDCKSMVTVTVSAAETLNIYPANMLEDGPYCYSSIIMNNVQLGSSATSYSLTTANEGIYSIQVTNASSGNSCWTSLQVVNGDCLNDVIAPTVYCKNWLLVGLLQTGVIDVYASDLSAGSFDNCTAPLELFMEKAPASAQPPTTNHLFFDSSDLGTNQLVLWATDAEGNASHCNISIVIEQCPGTNVLTCADTVHLVLEGTDPALVFPSDVLIGGPYCYGQTNISFENGPQEAFLSVFPSNAGQAVIQVLEVTTGETCSSTLLVNADCSSDNLAPIPVCKPTVSFVESSDGPNLTLVEAIDLDNGSYDNCTATNELSFAIELGTPSAVMPTTTSLSLTTEGVYDVVLWVADEAGNSQNCTANVVVWPLDCNADSIPPVLTVPNDTTVNYIALVNAGMDPSLTSGYDTYFGAATAWEACGMPTITQYINFINSDCSTYSQVIRYFIATDLAGNITALDSQVITLVNDYTISLPKDFEPTDTGAPENLVVLNFGQTMSIEFEDLVFDYDCDNNPDLIERKWFIVNWCDNGELPSLSLPRRDTDSDGAVGNAYQLYGTTNFADADSLYEYENGTPTTVFGNLPLVTRYAQYIRYNYLDAADLNLSGTVFMDASQNCLFDNGETTLADWQVKAVGQSTSTVYTATTQADGTYFLNGICITDTVLELSLNVPFNYGQSCPTTWTVALAEGDTIEQNIPVQLDADCDLMEVSLATPFLRRCFANNYTISYCNYSASTIEDTWVEVELDSFMEYNSSSIPGTLLSGNTYSFTTGDLAAGQCENFLINFDLSCEAELGQTHCTEAHIYPDTLCPQNAMWSGANIVVEGKCIEDEVHLSIKNTGNGSMAAPLDFIVVEDVIMYMQGSFDLGAGQTYEVPTITANGATWRLEAEQAPAHPYPGNVAVALEGCNGINELGIVNLFPVENPNPFIAVDCQENRGSFDPNDKQAVPIGYGEEHFIRQNTDIEYTIRFQNTGTDTAFTVVVEDVLSSFLDPSSIRPGASSHLYAFEIRNGNTVHFTFENILLPDSSVNLAASQGFVKFIAKQKPNIALGSVIENTAAIYFDFNEPITTNRVYHTIGKDFIEVISSAGETANVHGQPKVFPNPTYGGAVTFALPVELGENARFTLHDQVGKLAHWQAVSGDKFVFECQGMMPGIYFYSIENEGDKLFSGKVILK